MKIALIIACIGHIICGITDCMLAYMKNGRFEFSNVNDNKKMQMVFEGASLKQIELAMLMGVFALFLASFGYIGVSGMIRENSPVVGSIMLATSLFFIVLIAAHHVLCGATEWFYVRLGRTDDALNVIMEFFKRTSSVAIAYAGLLVFDILLFVMVVTGKTDIPRWGCVFNTLPAFLILAPTKIPAKGNIANAFMFLGLALCMIW